MVVEGRTIAVILIHIFAFLGYLKSKDIKIRRKKLDNLEKLKEFVENYKNDKEN